MQLVGSRGQQQRDVLFVADGTITSGNTAQLLLPERKSCSYLYIQNLSAHAMYVEFGGARATVTISNGQLSAFTVTNAGFGYLFPPQVLLFGGGSGGNTTFGNATLPANGAIPGWPAPGDAGEVGPRLGSPTDKPGRAHATLSTGTVGTIVVDDPGSGYVMPPFVFLRNSTPPHGAPDPFGVATPSSSSGYQLGATGSASNFKSWIEFNGTFCPTDAIAIVSSGTSDAFVCRWSP